MKIIKDELEEFIKITGLRDCGIEFGTLHDDVLDHIFIKDGKEIKIDILDYQYNYKNLQKLSDHSPIYVKLQIIY